MQLDTDLGEEFELSSFEFHFDLVDSCRPVFTLNQDEQLFYSAVQGDSETYQKIDIYEFISRVDMEDIADDKCPPSASFEIELYSFDGIKDEN